ncbi:MAG: hypothetical protein JWP97_3013 [Labilithrix sp.]|nr:hypothetical protein [Labilithrix sp.]
MSHHTTNGWHLVVAGLALAAAAVACAPAAATRAPAASARHDRALASPDDEPLVQVPDYELGRAPELFSEDGTVAAIRTPEGCRVWELPSGTHLGIATRGCERLVPAVRERVEAPPAPCSGCGEAVASVRDATEDRLAIARVAPSGLEIGNLRTKRLEARTTLEQPPEKGRLAWNEDGVHGVYRAESGGEGGLYHWQPGAAPVLTSLGGSEGNFSDAVFDPRGRFAIIKTNKIQRMTGGAVECFTLTTPVQPCGTLSTSPADEPGGASTMASPEWYVGGEGAQWWTRNETRSYEGALLGGAYTVVLTDAETPVVAAGAFVDVPRVDQETAQSFQPVHCFESAGKATCITERPTTCALEGVSAGGGFLVHVCDETLRITARDGQVAFTRKNAKLERWLGHDTALVVDAKGGVVLDLAHNSERPLAGGKPLRTLVSANRARLALGAEDAFRVFALPALDLVATLRVRSLGPSALSNDGKLLAIAIAGDNIEIYAVDTGARVLRIDGKASRLVFRADAALLFVDGVRAFDVRSGAERKDVGATLAAGQIDPFGRVVAIGDQTFRRLTDDVVLTLDAGGSAQTDTGFWDGHPLSDLRFRLGDPFSARWVTNKELGERLHHKGLVRAFFAGEPIGDPRLARRIRIETRPAD